MGTLKQIADSGKVRMVGLSNADPGGEATRVDHRLGSRSVAGAHCG
ncbi:hypothetical protein [Aestuariimicrobium ganziense]